jgi:putative ABC transport system permease protein
VNVGSLAWKGVKQRALSSTLTALSVALGVALVTLVFQLRGVSRRAFDDAARGYDVVLGGVHTSPLTTVLSTVFLADNPTDTIPIEAFRAIEKDPRVRHAVPYAVGDVYKGFRVVGTTPAFFEAIETAKGEPIGKAVDGRLLGKDDAFEAVAGAFAAARTGLKKGSAFQVTHGLEEGGHQHEDAWRVVGVLPPTGTPLDRAIFITLGSFFHIADHQQPDPGMHGEEPAGMEEEKDPVWAVSSIVVRLKSPAFRLQFVSDMRKRPDVQPALPATEISKLFRIVEQVDGFFRVVAWLVLVVSGIAILVSLYGSIEGRRREIAILRALGARPAHVFSVVTLEAVLLCLVGGALGLLLGHGGVAAAGPLLLETVGIRVAPEFGAIDVWIALGLVGMGLLTGFVPALRALRVPVAQNLHPLD